MSDPVDFIPELPPNDESAALLTLDTKTLKPPESRLGKTWAIRNRIAELRQQDDTRSKRRAKIKRWIDGDYPYSPQKLISNGQRERTNFNPREAEGMVDAAVTPWYSLVVRAPQFASINNSYGPQPFLRRVYGQKISANFHRLLQEWRGFSYELQLKHKEMVMFGSGFAMFPDADTWQWVARKNGEVLVPNKIKARVESIPEAVYFDEINPVDLYKMIADMPDDTDSGWFPKRVKQAIVRVAPQSTNQPGVSVFGPSWNEEMAASLRRGDVMWNSSDGQIKIAGYLVKEFNGKISRAILLDEKAEVTQVPDDSDPYLLFKKVGEFKCFDYILQPFFQDVGTGDWHSVRGLGAKIRDITVANARLLCRTIDGAMKSVGLILQALSGGAEEISQLAEISGADIIPADLKLEENRISQNLQGPMELRRELQNTLQNSTAQYLPRVSGENSEPTLGQAQLNARNQLQLSEAQSDRYCMDLDALYKEQVRRALVMGIACYKRLHKEADEPPDEYEVPEDFKNSAEEGAYWFVRRNVEDGVPLEAQEPYYNCQVKALRGVGSGSPAGQDIATRELMGMLPTMSPRGQRNALRMRASFLVGYSNVDLIYEPFEESGVPEDQTALAVLENNILRLPGGHVVITPLQDPVTHSMEHLKEGFQMVDQLHGGQADPQTTLVFLNQLGPHIKGHLMTFEGDPSREQQYNQMEAGWHQLTKVTDQLTQQVIEHLQSQQQKAPQPQIDPEMMAEMMKVRGELQIHEMKTKGKLAIDAEKTKAKNRLADLNQAFEMKRQVQQDQFERAQALIQPPAERQAA